MVLPPELVRARRRGEALLVSELSEPEYTVALAMAEEMLQLAGEFEGQSIEEFEGALGHLERPAKLEKVWAGIKKVIVDACEYADTVSPDPVEVRRELFLEAARCRLELADSEEFVRHKVLDLVAERLGTTARQLDEVMFADLKGAQLLIKGPRLRPTEVVEGYAREHIQGVLLRCVKLTATVQAADPAEYRRLFSKLKFRNLLFRLTSLGEAGYRIEIEGPFSLFEAVTKYGMQFALVLPALLECGQGHLVADLRWGKERRPLSFAKSWSAAALDSPKGDDATALRPEIQQLMAAIRKKNSSFTVEPCAELLHIPGEGLCIPDLKFSAPGRPNVYLELMGFWSRDAVWKRVEWSQSGRHERVVFAVSSRLRVSEQVLPVESGSSLYVFKGTLNAASVLQRIEALASLPT